MEKYSEHQGDLERLWSKTPSEETNLQLDSAQPQDQGDQEDTDPEHQEVTEGHWRLSILHH